MSWTVKSLVLPLVLLCMWRMQEGAQACTCGPVHPQTAFCQADVVIKAQVLARKLVGGFDKPVKYDLKQIKMFKGPNRGVDAIYTPASSAACGVTLTNGVEYLISGRLAPDGSLHGTVCDFIVPWDSLSVSQKTNLVEHYKKGCDCQITHCHTFPCKLSRPAQCLWTDFLTNLGNREQARHFACVKRSHGSCAWYRGTLSSKKGYMDTKGR
ncbi:metalloproteinase inhibitor 2-like [Dunckerocampus dactyliophorus]|uniref:metalloproteinase inhibitor 2-like n=1 Tax=Dunckerocampus dactyliophorus TaxID=161453 RepID=UPI002406ADC9|nr:metalloproteinase inhibitor 2-like [Dunckerocampus dactyliophorus]